MSKLKSVEDIRNDLMQLLQKKDWHSDDDTAFNEVCRKYERLVDRFYRENHELLAPAQCTAAKEDIEYFMRLIELAYSLHADNEKEKKKSVH